MICDLPPQIIKEVTVNIAEYARSFIGTKYTWGGESADEGFDCSGFVQEVLEAFGQDPKGDQTAQGLYDYFLRNGRSSTHPARGALCFYGNSQGAITHVALAINNYQIIEAGGEGRTPTNRGMVRIRPYNYRSDLIDIVMI